MASQVHHHCIACQSSTGHRAVYEKWGYTIQRCDSCGLGSAVVDPSFDSSTLYDEGYFQGARRDGYADYIHSEPVLRAEFRHIVKDIRRHASPDSRRLLEIGCAYGFFLMEASRHFECRGIDVAEAAVAHCQARGLNVKAGMLDRAMLDECGRLDVVVMLDVIEHLPDPFETLKLLSGSLNDGGLIAITTGDWSALLARLMGKRWRLMTPPQHLFYFTQHSLARLLENSGFEVLEARHPWKVVPAGLALYQITSRLRLPVPPISSLNTVGVPLNLFDAVRIIARKKSGSAVGTGTAAAAAQVR